jgi:nuclear transport factor 2 (NTF2) superfamily protein
MTADLAQLRDFAARYTAAWCSQEPTRVADFFSQDASLTVNNATPAVGRSAIAELARSFMTTFPDLKVVMDDLLVHANGVEYRWTLIGTNTGPGGTGRRVRVSGYERWQMAPDGLIAASHGHFDADEYRRQLERGEAE